MSDDTIAGSCAASADPQQAADSWSTWPTQAGGDDNITAVVIDVPTTRTATGGAHRPRPADGQRCRRAGGDGDRELRRTGERAAGCHAGARPGGAAAPGRDRRAAGGRARAGLPVIARRRRRLGGVGWYARRTYYVGLAGDRVTLFRGVPGGVLGWSPTVERAPDLTAADLTARRPARPGGRPPLASRSEATAVDRLEQERHATAATTTTDHDRPDVRRSRPAPRRRPPADRRGEPTGDVRRETPGRRRRSTELGLVVLAVIVAAGGYALTSPGRGRRPPRRPLPFAGGGGRPGCWRPTWPSAASRPGPTARCCASPSC